VNFVLVLVFVMLLFLLTLVSYVDRLYAEMGKFLSREFQDNIDSFESLVEPRLAINRERARLAVAIWVQLMTAAITLIVGYTLFGINPSPSPPEIAEAAALIILIVVVFNRVLPFVLFARTRGRWLARCGLLLRFLIYLSLPVTLVVGFVQSVTALTKAHSSELPETQAEAVDALIEAGQEEGILQEEDRHLIQSVVEFGEKTVREVMKPRPEMVAVPVTATVEQFVDLLKDKPFSRVPVYEGSIHNIKGILSAQDILQVPDTEAGTRTVDSIMRRDVHFVPETRRSNELLREMQKHNIRMAIVVDEYGSVAGLVTIEDLVEEIVGEIHDDHDKHTNVERESDSSYVVRGNMDVDRLTELFGERPEGKEAATVAGLVSELAGHIPQPGEVIEDGGLRFEILEATDRRVERVRITSIQAPELRLSAEQAGGE
jgi:putative hemolysin